VSAEEWSRLIRGSSTGMPGADAGERLRHAVRLGYDVAPGLIAGCSITELAGAQYATPASSDQLAAALDEAQYAAGRGPCMAAARDHQVHHLEDLRSVGQFEEFNSAAIKRGVLSSLSLPLDGTYRPAALNFYATSPGVFANARTRRVAALLAHLIANRMLQSESGVRAAATHRALSPEVQARADLIRRAQTRLASQAGSVEDAFTVLAMRSREEVRSIFDVARDVLATAPGHS
jgi:hypothetical protein